MKSANGGAFCRNNINRQNNPLKISKEVRGTSHRRGRITRNTPLYTKRRIQNKPEFSNLVPAKPETDPYKTFQSPVLTELFKEKITFRFFFLVSKSFFRDIEQSGDFLTLFDMQQHTFLFLIVICGLTAFTSFGETFSANKVTSITVKGPAWTMMFTQTPGPYRFELKGEASFQNEEGNVVIKSSRHNSRKDWETADWNKTRQREELTVKGPSAPLSLYVSSGSIQIVRWKHPVFISARQGQVTSRKSTGMWRIALKNGQFKTYEHRGRVQLQGFSLDTLLKDSKGSFKVLFNEGNLKTQGGNGSLHFVTDRGNTNIKQFEGSLKGSLVSGTLTASLKPKDVQVFSDRGDIRFNFRNTGARVAAHSENGKIYSPRHFFKQYSGKSLTVKGHLKGRPKTGSVSLETNTGNIYFQ